MKKLLGFTLIEILIALAVFSIMASITSSLLYNAFTSRARVNEQSQRLNQLQLAISLMQQDTIQIVDRAIRGNDMQLFPGFVGQNMYVEFTRDGFVNPQSTEKRSNLQRIAYVCEEDKLLRRTWETLDSLDRNVYEDKILVDKLTACNFGYLGKYLQVYPEWRLPSVSLKRKKINMPIAIQINLTLGTQGSMNLLFIITGALYAGK